MNKNNFEPLSKCEDDNGQVIHAIVEVHHYDKAVAIGGLMDKLGMSLVN